MRIRFIVFSSFLLFTSSLVNAGVISDEVKYGTIGAGAVAGAAYAGAYSEAGSAAAVNATISQNIATSGAASAVLTATRLLTPFAAALTPIPLADGTLAAATCADGSIYECNGKFKNLPYAERFKEMDLPKETDNSTGEWLFEDFYSGESCGGQNTKNAKSLGDAISIIASSAHCQTNPPDPGNYLSNISVNGSIVATFMVCKDRECTKYSSHTRTVSIRKRPTNLVSETEFVNLGPIPYKAIDEVEAYSSELGCEWPLNTKVAEVVECQWLRKDYEEKKAYYEGVRKMIAAAEYLSNDMKPLAERLAEIQEAEVKGSVAPPSSVSVVEEKEDEYGNSIRTELTTNTSIGLLNEYIKNPVLNGGIDIPVQIEKNIDYIKRITKTSPSGEVLEDKTEKSGEKVVENRVIPAVSKGNSTVINNNTSQTTIVNNGSSSNKVGKTDSIDFGTFTAPTLPSDTEDNPLVNNTDEFTQIFEELFKNFDYDSIIDSSTALIREKALDFKPNDITGREVGFFENSFEMFQNSFLSIGNSLKAGLPKSSSCPPPYEFSFLGSKIVISYEPFCDVIRKLGEMLLWLMPFVLLSYFIRNKVGAR